MAPGDKLHGTITGTSGTGTCAKGVCTSWTITLADLTRPSLTTTLTTPAGAYKYVQLQGAVVETYNIDSCAMMPPGPLSFTSIAAKADDGSTFTPSWTYPRSAGRHHAVHHRGQLPGGRARSTSPSPPAARSSDFQPELAGGNFSEPLCPARGNYPIHEPRPRCGSVARSRTGERGARPSPIRWPTSTVCTPRTRATSPASSTA